MSFLQEGIQDVRVFVLPDGVATEGRCVAMSRVALVTWRSSHVGSYHQVYVNGRFGGATIEAEQRQLVVHAPRSIQSAVRVTVIAVEIEDAHVDFSDEVAHACVNSGRIRLALLRNQSLPIGAIADIYFDHGTEEVDYTEPLNASPIPLWPCMQDKAGFGTAQFGMGDFGYDSAAAVGFGKGAFGHGQFGLDVDSIEWVSPLLPLGRYRFGVRVTDESGNESLASETEPITVVPAAKPAAKLDVVAFDRDINQLTLSVTG